MTTSIYDQWETDQKVEQEGIILDYGEPGWIKCARAGGSNSRYHRRINQLYTKHRRKIDGGILDEDMLRPELIQIFADTVVLEGKLLDRDGNEVNLQGNKRAVVKFFTDLPELFRDVREQTGGMELFRVIDREEDAKN